MQVSHKCSGRIFVLCLVCIQGSVGGSACISRENAKITLGVQVGHLENGWDIVYYYCENEP